MKKIAWKELAVHNNEKDCWLAIHGSVYDLTAFLSEHPGGAKILLNQAGKDATPAFDRIHSKDVLKDLPPSAFKGFIDESSSKPEGTTSTISEAPQKKVERPPLAQMLNVMDFESVARQVMEKEGWDYYSSGGDDEITLRENRAAFQRIWFKPRVLVNVKEIDMSCTMLGTPCSFPVYITATAMGKLADPEGEVVLTRAAHTHGVIQMCPTLGSCTVEEMTSAAQPGQVQWFQLYVNSNRKLTEELIRRAEKGGCKALAITVDAPQLGRREKDMRNKVTASAAVQKDDLSVKRDQGVAQALSSFIDPALCWDDIKWFQSITKLPILLKGIQCAEDAVLAVQHGVAGIILSNHGGRQLDFARSAIEILPEVMDALKKIGAEKKIEVYIDGGVRRGTDILKALALGAKGVGIGRPFLYAMAGYGQAGVEKALAILKQELRMAMSLIGAPKVADLKPEMVITRNISDHFVPTPADYLSLTTYEPIQPAAKL